MGLDLHVVTIFPDFFNRAFSESILGRASAKKKVQFGVHNLRDYVHDRHKTVDDKPFGGGAGMLMKPEPFFDCVESIPGPKGWVVSLDPHGKPFKQRRARALAKKEKLIFLAGHYEGVDHRVREHLVDEEISLGDFITMGGEAPALCVIEAIVRLLPGVLGNDASIEDESFQTTRLEYPQYTRPSVYRNWKVPEVLLSGHHKEIAKWRKEQALKITEKKRPDLLA